MKLFLEHRLHDKVAFLWGILAASLIRLFEKAPETWFVLLKASITLTCLSFISVYIFSSFKRRAAGWKYLTRFFVKCLDYLIGYIVVFVMDGVGETFGFSGWMLQSIYLAAIVYREALTNINALKGIEKALEVDNTHWSFIQDFIQVLKKMSEMSLEKEMKRIEDDKPLPEGPERGEGASSTPDNPDA